MDTYLVTYRKRKTGDIDRNSLGYQVLVRCELNTDCLADAVRDLLLQRNLCLEDLFQFSALSLRTCYGSTIDKYITLGASLQEGQSLFIS